MIIMNNILIHHSRTSWNFVLDGNIFAVYFGKVSGSRRHRPSILGHYSSLVNYCKAFSPFFGLLFINVMEIGSSFNIH